MDSSFTQIRRIDNSQRWMPFATTFLVISMFAIFIWFFRGGSFRLYASVFFGLYSLTGQVWVSVLLVGVLQNIFFLPLRFVSLALSTRLSEFEDELAKVKSESDQYLIFSDKVKKGDPAVVFFIFNFVVNAIAFLSAGRIFLIDFYTQKLNPHYLYSFIPYPQYPLQGTNFYFPFLKVTGTFALDWRHIFLFWIFAILLLSLPRLLWRFLRIFFRRNQQILRARIRYNRASLVLGGFMGTLFVVSLILLRNFPTSFQGLFLVANLTRQNTTMNIITAIGTFITVLHAGYARQRIASEKARKSGISDEIIARVARQNLGRGFQNAVLLGIGAFFVTNRIPCAFELSVATFEILYILSPYTFDKFLTSVSRRAAPQPSPVPISSSPA